MADEKGIGIGGIAIAAIAAFALWPKKSSGSGDGTETAAGEMAIEIIPAGSEMSQMAALPPRLFRFRRAGLRQARMGYLSPLPLIEGTTGNIMRCTIKNTSTRAGQPAAYTFALEARLRINEAFTIGPPNPTSVSCAAGETKVVDVPFDLVTSGGPVSGSYRAYANLVTNDGQTLLAKSNELTGTIALAAVIPSGTISI